MISPDIFHWLALNNTRGIIPIHIIEKVFNEFHSIEPLWEANVQALSNFGLDKSSITRFLKYRDSVKPTDYEPLVADLEERKPEILRYVDKKYPVALRDLNKTSMGPPLILFHKGTFSDFNNCVAIVGTRDLSHFGHMMARKLGRSIAKKGYTIVSGLARGADTEAHCGALEVPRGRTIAILAWLDPIYPSENTELSNDIAARGALLSENYYSTGAGLGRLHRVKFVERNRVTSGISRCLIAVESGKEGGTFHQVRIALSQERKVFALKPKSSNKRAMEGHNTFVEMGATSISSAKPILNFLKKSSSETAFGEKRIDSFSKSPTLTQAW